jgi:hypothetical protein
MKSIVNICRLLSVVCIISISSCQKSNSSTAASTSADTLTAAITSGNWAVGSLTQKKEDNTGKFAGYTFRFSSNGKVTAILNGVETQGTWSHTPAVTYYGSSSSEAIVISLGTDNLFRRLSKTWNVMSKTGSSIKLDNPEVLEDEHLQLQKQ